MIDEVVTWHQCPWCPYSTRFGSMFEAHVAHYHPKETHEVPSPSSPSDPLGPRSAERHDSVYGLPHSNERQWLHSFYERYKSTLWFGDGESGHSENRP